MLKDYKMYFSRSVSSTGVKGLRGFAGTWEPSRAASPVPQGRAYRSPGRVEASAATLPWGRGLLCVVSPNGTVLPQFPEVQPCARHTRQTGLPLGANGTETAARRSSPAGVFECVAVRAAPPAESDAIPKVVFRRGPAESPPPHAHACGKAWAWHPAS